MAPSPPHDDETPSAAPEPVRTEPVRTGPAMAELETAAPEQAPPALAVSEEAGRHSPPSTAPSPQDDSAEPIGGGGLEDSAGGDEALKTFFAAIFAEATVGLSELSLAGRFLRVNEELCRILGRTQNELEGMEVNKVIFPEDLDKSTQALQQLIETGAPNSIEERYVRPDGNIVWVKSSLTLLRGRNGSSDTILVVTVDFTERQQAKIALQESEERLRAIVNQSSAGIAGVGKDSRLKFANGKFCELLGYTEAELVHRTFPELIYPEDIARSRRLLARLSTYGEPFQTEVRFLRKDGSFIWANVSAGPISDGDKTAFSAVAVIVDITERRHDQEALRASEEQYRLLVEGTKDYAMFMIDTQRRITHWNYGAERIFGHTREQAINQLSDIIFTPEDRAAGQPVQEVEIAIREGTASDVRWHLRKDGTRFWASGVLTRLHDENGKLRGFAKITRDATGEREAEEKLRQANSDLEGRVAERTRELALANESLTEQIAQRERAEQAQEHLLLRLVMTQEEERQRISRELHDQMGQQLTALLLGLKTLPTGGKAADSDLKQRLEALQQLTVELSQHMHDLAWQLRPPILDNFGLEKALRQQVEDWSQSTGIAVNFIGRGLPQKAHYPSPVETALYRIVQEALTNIQRHAAAQYVSVLLSGLDSSLAVTVADNGRGFDYQESDLTSGTSLGLLGMKERMQLVGGSLTVESTPGEGTTIYARVPISSETAPEKE